VSGLKSPHERLLLIRRIRVEAVGPRTPERLALDTLGVESIDVRAITIEMMGGEKRPAAGAKAMNGVS
jgi:hypothetical protein